MLAAFVLAGYFFPNPGVAQEERASLPQVLPSIVASITGTLSGDSTLRTEGTLLIDRNSFTVAWEQYAGRPVPDSIISSSLERKHEFVTAATHIICKVMPAAQDSDNCFLRGGGIALALMSVDQAADTVRLEFNVNYTRIISNDLTNVVYQVFTCTGALAGNRWHFRECAAGEPGKIAMIY